MVVAACVKIPEFKGGDGGTDSPRDDAPSDGSTMGIAGASAMIDGSGGVLVKLPGVYEMRFSSLGYGFPYNWAIGPDGAQTHVLYAPADQSCVLERDMGVSFFPAHVLASVPTNGASAGTGDLNIDIAGPSIAKVRTNWSATLSCGSQVVGSSTFTFFPDGRISRMDFGRMPSATAANSCDCAGDADWRVYGYTVFKRDVTNGVQGVAYPASTNMAGAAMTGTQCIESNSNKFRIGVAWLNTQGTRIRAPDDNSFAIAGDLTPSAQTIGGSGNPVGHLGDTTTTMFVSLTDSCTAVKARVQPFTGLDPQLDVAVPGETVPMGMSQDGLFGGETAFSNGLGGRAVSGVPVTIRPKSVNIPPFGLWLDLGLAARQTDPILDRMPVQAAPWYTVQRPTPTQYLFWFPDGLAVGETIVIRPE